jgi:transposase
MGKHTLTIKKTIKMTNLETIYNEKKSGANYTELAEKYKIKISTLRNWIIQYCQENGLEIPINKVGRKKLTSEDKLLNKFVKDWQSGDTMSEGLNTAFGNYYKATGVKCK